MATTSHAPRWTSRIGRLLRWIATALAALCIIGFVGTRWYRIDAPLGSLVGWPRLAFCGEYGRLVLIHNTEEHPQYDWHFHRISDPYWVFEFDEYDTDWYVLMIPLWVPAALLVAVSAALWWRPLVVARRRRRGCCTNCGYDLRGNAGRICPECGTAGGLQG